MQWFFFWPVFLTNIFTLHYVGIFEKYFSLSQNDKKNWIIKKFHLEILFCWKTTLMKVEKKSSSVIEVHNRHQIEGFNHFKTL